MFRITEPVAKGIALNLGARYRHGKSDGDRRAEGAMSSLSIAVSGIITVAGAALANLY
ncbi:MAG: hypothetical protein ACLSG5_06645 [Oscillospiraceae bacterium]